MKKGQVIGPIRRKPWSPRSLTPERAFQMQSRDEASFDKMRMRYKTAIEDPDQVQGEQRRARSLINDNAHRVIEHLAVNHRLYVGDV
jgi:hypothetical protein